MTRNRFSTAALLAALLSASAPALAQDTASAAAQRTHEHTTEESVDHSWPLNSDYATGDWLGARTSLEDRGITFGMSITIDASRNFQNGISTSTGAFRHLFDANLTIETEPLIGLPGGTFFIDFQNQNGRNGTEELTGDFQGFSNIDDDGFTQIAELWYEQRLFEKENGDDLLRIKLGKVEANSEFAFVEHGGEFLNSSPGFSPTILGFPSYPDPSTSVNIFVYPTDNLYVGFGLYDGATHDGHFGRTGSRGPSTFFGEPGDLFVVGEVGYTWICGDGLDGRVGVGFWGHTGDFERFDGGSNEDGTTGMYIVLDQMLFREDPSAEDDAQGIGAFFQFGLSDEAVAEADIHVGFGAAWTGLVPSRDDDVLGAMVSYVHLSSDARDAGVFDESHETAFELFYKAQITPWLSLKPDLQYIVNTGGDSSLGDTLVGTLRVEVAF